MGRRTLPVEYDQAGRLTAVDLPGVYNPDTSQIESPRYEYGYDAQGNQTLLRDPLGRETWFTFDAQHLHISFEGVVTEHVYSDATGRLIEKRFFDNLTRYDNGTGDPGEVWAYTHDAFGRITHVAAYLRDAVCRSPSLGNHCRAHPASEMPDHVAAALRDTSVDEILQSARGSVRMRTDKQLLRIFETAPEWIFELTGLPSPGSSTLKSLTVKALERRADGVVIPKASDGPLTVVEFQFQKDATAYPLIVVEMALLQQSHQMRAVQGLIFFGYNELDPKTEPWTQVVRAYSFPDVLRQFEQSHPGHPLVAAFKPLMVENDTELRRDAAAYYRTIRESDLPIVCKETLQEVFVSWLEQRLKYLGKKDMEMILLGELPELEETQCGKDLVQIGEARGLAKAILRYLTTRFGSIPGEMEQQIRSLTAEQAERLLQFVLQCETVAEAAQWLRDI